MLNFISSGLESVQGGLVLLGHRNYDPGPMDHTRETTCMEQRSRNRPSFDMGSCDCFIQPILLSQSHKFVQKPDIQVAIAIQRSTLPSKTERVANIGDPQGSRWGHGSASPCRTLGFIVGSIFS